MNDTPNYLVRLLTTMFRPRGKPFLIWAAGPLLMLWGAYGAFFMIIAAISPGGFVVDGVDISNKWYIGVVYGLVMIVTMLMAFTGFGLFSERAWARALATKWAAVSAVAMWCLMVLMGVSAGRVLLSAGQTTTILLLSFWYFYRYEPVVAYYGRLSCRE